MILCIAGGMTLLYLLLWPFSLRLDARLTPLDGRGELTVASLFRLRFVGNLLRPPMLRLYRLDAQSRRRRLGGGKGKGQGGFRPVVRDRRLHVTLCVGVAGDGALTVEALGLVYALLETVGRPFLEELVIRPVPCFDKTVCALRLS